MGATTPIAWGIAGFVIGAVFWHSIGFWGFVERIVYKGRPDEAAHYVAQTGPECVSLSLDAETRALVATECPLDAPLLNEGVESVRSDFAGTRPSPQKSSARIRISHDER